jgi:phage antirepressor YoqD-like protein
MGNIITQFFSYHIMSDSNIQLTQTSTLDLTAYNTDGLELFFTSNRKVRASQSAIARMCKVSEATIRNRCSEPIVKNDPKCDVVYAQTSSTGGGKQSKLHNSRTIKILLKEFNPGLWEQFEDFGIDEGLAQMAGVPLTVQPTPSPFQIPTTLSEALFLAGELAEKVDTLEAKIEADSEATALGEFLNKGEGLIGMGEMARILEVGRNRLFIELRELSIIMKGKTTPYQWCHEAGYFKVTETLDNNGDIVMVTLITPKGQKYLAKRHKKFLANEWMVVRVEKELNLA